MQLHEKLISTPTELEKLVESLSASDLVALDTEFIREHTFFPRLALIQVATREESWLIDPLPFKGDAMRPFLDFLRDKRVRKILHAAQADQECFYSNYGLLVHPSFDTAVGASLSGFGESAGLGRLVREVLGVNLPKGHSRTDWMIRPLQKDMVRYAHQDVQYLIPLTERLFEALKKSGRLDWALELSEAMENPELYDANPERLAFRVIKNRNLERHLNPHSYRVLLDLMAWREQAARAIDIPRKRVVEDEVILDLVVARPKDLEHLSRFRGLSKGILKQQGDAILKAIAAAEAVPDADLKPVPRIETPSQFEERGMELFQVYLRILSEKLQISVKHLVPPESALRLFRGRYDSYEKFCATGILSKGALPLIGEDVFRFLTGREALRLIDGQVDIATGTI